VDDDLEYSICVTCYAKNRCGEKKKAASANEK
jgi:hypothetical protein